MKKLKNKKISVFFITLILIFSFSLPSFASAWVTVSSVSLKDMTVLSNEGITIRNSGSGYTHLTGTSSQVGLSFVYDTYSKFNFTVGQNYKIDFTCSDFGFTTDARPIGMLIYGTDKLDDASDSSNAVTYGNFSSMQLSSSGTFECQFTYTGQQYIVVMVTISKLNSFEISPFRVQRYNPNAEVESKLDEQNSLLNQQIDENSENWSKNYEQQSELQSKLFDEGETYSLPDIDLSEQYSLMNENPFFDGASDWQSNNHIVNGIKAFSFYFSGFWDSLMQDDYVSWIRYVIYFSAVVSLFLLIVGHISVGGDGGSSGGSSGGSFDDDRYKRHKIGF